MKANQILITLLLATFTGPAMAVFQSTGSGPAGKKNQLPPNVKNEAFTKGETLKYRVRYGFVEAGTAEIKVLEEDKKIAGRDVYHIVGTGKSKGSFDWFFRVRDRFETYVDQDGLFPWVFVRHCDEGGYKIDQNYTFYQHRSQVETHKGDTLDVPLGVQDMISAYYYARNMDFQNAQPGDTFSVQSFVDHEVWPLRIKYLGKATVRTKKGKFDCLRFCPVVQKGRIFKTEEDMSVYISDDKNKIPVLVEAKLVVGSIKMELTDYKGLRNEVALAK